MKLFQDPQHASSIRRWQAWIPCDLETRWRRLSATHKGIVYYRPDEEVKEKQIRTISFSLWTIPLHNLGRGGRCLPNKPKLNQDPGIRRRGCSSWVPCVVHRLDLESRLADGVKEEISEKKKRRVEIPRALFFPFISFYTHATLRSAYSPSPQPSLFPTSSPTPAPVHNVYHLRGRGDLPCIQARRIHSHPRNWRGNLWKSKE